MNCEFSRMTNGQRESSDRSSRDRLWMMMGATLNPNSSMADEMENVLKHEVQDHSIYDTSMQTVYHQVPLPGGKRSLAAVSYTFSFPKFYVNCTITNKISLTIWNS